MTLEQYMRVTLTNCCLLMFLCVGVAISVSVY